MREIKLKLVYDDGTKPTIVTPMELAELAIEQGEYDFKPWAEEFLDTGFKDRNGESLFEGDKIKWTLKGKGNQTKIGIIEYSEELREYMAGDYYLYEIIDSELIKD